MEECVTIGDKKNRILIQQQKKERKKGHCFLSRLEIPILSD